MSVLFLHVSEIIAIHSLMLQRYGGISGIRDLTRLQALVCDLEGMRDVVVGFSRIMQCFLRGQPFTDGNTRTAFAVGDVFLRLNGCYLAADAAYLEQRIASWSGNVPECAARIQEDVRRCLTDTRTFAVKTPSFLPPPPPAAEESLAARLAPYAVVPPRRPPTRSFQQTIKAAFRFQQDSVDALKEMFREIRRNRRFKAQPVTRAVGELVRLVGQNAEAMVAMYSLYTTDLYTYRHCINVATLSVAFGAFLGCSQKQLQHLGLAGFLHDVGKQFIPLDIINAPRRLTEEEFQYMQRHPTLGYDLLRQVADIPEVVRQGVLDHHEKADGSGYPGGKQGADISPIGAIISVVDTYDALSHDRAYRTGLPPARALSVLYTMRNAFFPYLAERFIRCIGVYPVGSLVRLSSGDMAVVCEANPSARINPKVVVIENFRQPTERTLHLLDLTKHDISITDCLDPRRYAVDCFDILKAVARLSKI